MFPRINILRSSTHKVVFGHRFFAKTPYSSGYFKAIIATHYKILLVSWSSALSGVLIYQ